MTLNLATLFEAVAAAVPGRPALVRGDHGPTFAEQAGLVHAEFAPAAESRSD